MKKLLLFSIVLILFNCSKKIDAKDLQGVWWSSGNNESKGFYPELVFDNDSIVIINNFGMPHFGKYLLKYDSIFMKIDNASLGLNINYKKQDSTLNINGENYWKRYNTLQKKQKKIHLINLKSKNEIHIDSLNGSILKAIKNNKGELKVILNDKTTNINEIPNFMIRCTDGKNYYLKPNIIIGSGINLTDLKKIYIELFNVNYTIIRLLTYENFQSQSFYYYNKKIAFFRDEISINIPPSEFDLYKKEFIQKFNPKLLSIKSKSDFKKLKEIIPNTRYLISIDINLPIKDYLHLTQELNSIKKVKKVKIRTEIIKLI